MKFYSLYALILFFYYSCAHPFEKTTYTFCNDPIDVVIPCHPKDAMCLEKTIQSIQKYVKDIRRIIVISSSRITDTAEWVDEKIFPFTKESLALEIFKSPRLASYQLNRSKSRMGWVYQQFLKLFASYYIPEISSNVLIVDADVIFLKPITFLQENGAGLYAVKDRRNPKYFEHITQLLPTLTKYFDEYSGVVHHMLFQKPILDDLMREIQERHTCEPWIAIARAITLIKNDMREAALSEYDLYFNFAFSRTNQVKIRPLKWKETTNPDNSHEQIIQKLSDPEYDFIAIHIRPHEIMRHMRYRINDRKRNTRSRR
jgi:hypothetical protein